MDFKNFSHLVEQNMQLEHVNDSMRNQLSKNNCQTIVLSEDEDLFDKSFAKRFVAEGSVMPIDMTTPIPEKAQEYLDELTRNLYKKINKQLAGKTVRMSLAPPMIRKYDADKLLLGFRLYASVCII